MKDTELSEQDISTKKVIPALVAAGWDIDTQIREQVTFTAGRINVYGKLVTRGERKRADIILYYKPNIPLAVIEVKDASYEPSSGMQQALTYADMLDIPFVYSTNGQGFAVHYRIKISGKVETEFPMDHFPSPEDLYKIYCEANKITSNEKSIVSQDYHSGIDERQPYYFQQTAINRAVEAVAREQKRILLVMATGTGKTYTAFQIIWRLWKSRKKKRILFLVDRTALATQTMQGDFRHFGDKMTKIERKIADPAYEIYVALYQGLASGETDPESLESEKQLFKQFSPDFFDLVIVDECHRGSAKDNSAWREILDYYSSATQIGLTATPKEDKDVNTSEYFDKPVYTYSLKQGIEDGFLAPYKVIRYILDKDIEWRPNSQVLDQKGKPIEDRVYNVSDYDRNIVIKNRTRLVAETITKFMKETDPMQKAIIFCIDIDHAERMRQELVNANPDQVNINHRYVVRITGDNIEGKREIENLINPESPYPVLVTTSKLLTTGVDAKTCKLIVLDAPINSMTEFKQIIGRGTRIDEDHGKYYFTIMDFRGVTRLFADPEFDGTPIKDLESKEIKDEKDIPSIAEEIEEETKHAPELSPQEQILFDPNAPQVNSSERPIVDDGSVKFNVLTKVVSYIDPATGKLITESLTDFSKKKIQESFNSLDDFLKKWTTAEKKDAIIEELQSKGIAFDELKKEVGLNVDEFDLVLHIAYGKKPLTRRERVEEIRKRDYFGKYEGRAREVIEALLDKYADQGSTAIDGIEDLKVLPFTDFGTTVEIVDGIFGGREKYLEVVRNLQEQLYKSY
jgi:type I restriction enzyme R subunit